MVASTNGALIGSMTSDREGILADWEAAVRGSQRSGRSSPDLQSELSSLYDAILSGVGSGGDIRSDGMGEVRALLNEMSFACGASGIHADGDRECGVRVERAGPRTAS